MATVNKIESNSTNTRWCEETALKTVNGTSADVWVPMEPDSYSDFGGQVTTTPRAPITDDRMARKGVVTDLDASGSMTQDFTQTNSQELCPGFFLANFRKKGEVKNPIGVTTTTISATATGSVFTRVGGSTDLTTQFNVGDLVFVSGFSNSANNGLFRVDAVTTTTIDVTTANGAEAAVTLVDESATSAASIVKVGIEATAGDIDVDMTGTRPALTSTTLDFTDLDLVVGEFVFIGGDEALTKFTTASDVNSGFARVRSIAANRLEFDKTQRTMVTEASTTEHIQIFTGTALKNETGTNIVRRSYQIERTLGAPDDASPAQIQSEYVTGSFPNQLTLNVQTASKLSADFSFVGLDHEHRTGATGVKPGTRPTLSDSEAFNTSSDVSVMKLQLVNETDANPDSLVNYLEEMTVRIDNQATPDKAISVLGGFGHSTGLFSIEGDVTAYFNTVAAQQSVRNNSDATLHMHVVKSNAGFTIDIPLIDLGDGRLNVSANEAVKIPLSLGTSTGKKIDTNMNHVLLMVFWDYLPTLAD